MKLVYECPVCGNRVWRSGRNLDGTQRYRCTVCKTPAGKPKHLAHPIIREVDERITDPITLSTLRENLKNMKLQPGEIIGWLLAYIGDSEVTKIVKSRFK